MNRREFVAAGVAAGLTAMGTQRASAQPANRAKFRMKYAPHFGMFKNSAGDDPIDQLKFAADQGFTAWEDNSMKGRSVQDQERVAQTMADLGMTSLLVSREPYQSKSIAGE